MLIFLFVLYVILNTAEKKVINWWCEVTSDTPLNYRPNLFKSRSYLKARNRILEYNTRRKKMKVNL